MFGRKVAWPFLIGYNAIATERPGAKGPVSGDTITRSLRKYSKKCLCIVFWQEMWLRWRNRSIALGHAAVQYPPQRGVKHQKGNTKKQTLRYPKEHIQQK